MIKKPIIPHVKSNEGAGVVPDFIQKLFRMLENKSFNDTFCWGPDGTTFLVKDINDFSRTILPKHFKHCNFASFVRQLNKYDFHKVRNPEDGHRMYADQVWVHPKFRRDRKDLLEEIRRKSPGKPKKDKVVLTGDTDTLPLAPSADPEPSSQSIESLLELTRNLQAQVDGLRKSQTDMELQMQQMNRADQQIADELAQFSKSMAAKDNLLQQFVKIDAENNHSPQRQSHHIPLNINSADNNNNNNSNSSNSNSQPIYETYQEPLDTKPGPSKKRKDCGTYQGPEVWLQGQLSSSEQTAEFREIQAIPLIHLAKQTFDGSGSMQTTEPLSVHLEPKVPERLALVTVGRLATKQGQQVDKSAEKGRVEATPVAMSPRSMNSGSATGKVALPGWTVSPRILLVDDDSVYRDISRKLLNTIGCTIDLAQDGLEALRKMGLEKYDLILMDIVMPNLDGISATRNIRQYDLLTPIISMTSNFSDSDIMQYIGSGMTDILPKPFSKITLYNILEKYCAHLRAIQRVQGSVDPSIVHRSLGNLGLLPPSNISETELPMYKADGTFSMATFPSLAQFPANMSTSLPTHFISPYAVASSAVSTAATSTSSSASTTSSTSPPGASNVATDMFWSVAQPYQGLSASAGARTVVMAPENDGKIVWIMPPQITDETYKDTENTKRRKMEEP